MRCDCLQLHRSAPCRGLLIYVQGDATIAGTLSMTARGAKTGHPVSVENVNVNGLQLTLAVPTGGGPAVSSLPASIFTGAGTAAETVVANHGSGQANGSPLTFSVSALGGTGAPGAQGSYVTGIDGTAGSCTPTGQCVQTGGGSSGGMTGGSGGTSGAGGQGSAFSGGSGGSGENCNQNGIPAEDWGGSGGGGGCPGGGAGNPGPGSAGDGTGGLVILLVGGQLTISGSIVSEGVSGTWEGGASGGGAALILHGGTLTNTGTISMQGGDPGTSNRAGGWGGLGSHVVAQVSPRCVPSPPSPPTPPPQPPPPPKTCTTSADCATGEVCTSGGSVGRRLFGAPAAKLCSAGSGSSRRKRSLGSVSKHDAKHAKAKSRSGTGI